MVAFAAAVATHSVPHPAQTLPTPARATHVYDGTFRSDTGAPEQNPEHGACECWQDAERAIIMQCVWVASSDTVHRPPSTPIRLSTHCIISHPATVLQCVPNNVISCAFTSPAPDGSHHLHLHYWDDLDESLFQTVWPAIVATFCHWRTGQPGDPTCIGLLEAQAERRYTTSVTAATGWVQEHLHCNLRTDPITPSDHFVHQPRCWLCEGTKDGDTAALD